MNKISMIDEALVIGIYQGIHFLGEGEKYEQ